MTIANTTVKAIYAGNGSNTTFAIPFAYFVQTEVFVYIRENSSTPATETLQTAGSQYNLSPATYPSTNVVFVTAPSATQEVIVARILPLTQAVDYADSGAFPAGTHENALDRLEAQIQQMQEQLDRSLKVRRSTDGVSVDLPDPVASNLLGWNPAGTAVVNYAASGLGSLTVSIGGASGGGGGSDWYDGQPNAPEQQFENGEKVYLYAPGETQRLTKFVKVPQSYVAGQAIKMYIYAYSPSTTNNFLLQSTSYLVRKNVDAVGSTTNSRASTNTAVTNTVANQGRELTLDIAATNGTINSVAIQPGDMIRVELFRGTDTDTDNVRFVPSSTEVTFQ